VAALDELPGRVVEGGFGAPAVVVVGDVVRLHESLAWFERLPLFGKRVLVTRDEGPEGRLTQALRAAGAEPVAAPMIRLAAPLDWRAIDAALDAVDSYDALLVTSANAVRFLASRAEQRGVALDRASWQVMCVGPKTADAVRALGWEVHLVPDRQYDADGLLRAIAAEGSPRGRRFFFPCAADAREVLSDGLTAAGAVVDRATAYRTLPPDESAESLRGKLLAGDLDALTFTSPSCVRNFAAALDADSHSAARRCIVACIGPVTAAALHEVDLEPDVVAERAGVAELVAALADRAEADAKGNP
jgi:uroporphyrinogen III methyltransferase/synthase